MVVTTSQFRNNQAHYLNLAAGGEHVIIRRKDNSSFMLVPCEVEEKVALSAETLKSIERSVKEYSEGNYETVSTPEELTAFLDSL